MNEVWRAAWATILATACGNAGFEADGDGLFANDAPKPYAETETNDATTVDTSARSGAANCEMAKRCVDRKVLVYNLQPAASSPSYETLGQTLVSAANAQGLRASFENRTTTPALSAALLAGFEVLVLVSGCGGDAGAPSAAEEVVIKSFYLGGNSLAVITDDDQGDSSAPGSCNGRVRPLARHFGVDWTGLVDNQTHGCRTVASTHPLLAGVKLGRHTSAKTSFVTPTDPWGADVAVSIGTLTTTGSIAEALVEAKNGHGAALFSPDFGSAFGCDSALYVRHIAQHLGCVDAAPADCSGTGSR